MAITPTHGGRNSKKGESNTRSFFNLSKYPRSTRQEAAKSLSHYEAQDIAYQLQQEEAKRVAREAMKQANGQRSFAKSEPVPGAESIVSCGLDVGSIDAHLATIEEALIGDGQYSRLSSLDGFVKEIFGSKQPAIIELRKQYNAGLLSADELLVKAQHVIKTGHVVSRDPAIQSLEYSADMIYSTSSQSATTLYTQSALFHGRGLLFALASSDQVNRHLEKPDSSRNRSNPLLIGNEAIAAYFRLLTSSKT